MYLRVLRFGAISIIIMIKSK